MNHDSSSPARAAPVTARGQATRLRILRSAETVFGHKGYDGASIAEICRLADTALGSFYVYFPDWIANGTPNPTTVTVMSVASTMTCRLVAM